jgi:hypothetical protein
MRIDRAESKVSGGPLTQAIAQLLLLVNESFVVPYELVGLVIQITTTEPSISVIEWQPGANRISPSREVLVEFGGAEITRRFLHEAFSDITNWDQSQCWLRIKSALSTGTSQHTDLPHFRRKLAAVRGIPNLGTLCCFCGCTVSCASCACDRCGGAGLLTVWVPLTNGLDPDCVSMLIIGPPSNEVTFPFLSGDRLWFEGTETHRANTPSRGSDLRVSVDARVIYHEYLPSLGHPPLDEKRELVWLACATKTLVECAHLRRNESINLRFLFELFGAHDLVASTPCLSEARSFRAVRCRLGFASDPENIMNYRVLGPVVHAWMMSSSDLESKAILRRAFVTFPSDAQFRLTRKSGRAYVTDCSLVVYATHLVFMLTDWMAAPHRWAAVSEQHVPHKDRQKVLRYCRIALSVITQAGKEAQNAEIFLEVAGVVGVLVPGEEGHLDCAQRLALTSDQEWIDIVTREQYMSKCQRHSQDVAIHCLVLRAWICRLRPETRNLDVDIYNRGSLLRNN